MFKVGDKVRVIKNTSGGHKEGTVGVIDFIDTAYSEPQYLVKGDGQKWWHKGNNLELFIPPFGSNDLKAGMVVSRRNGDRALYLADVCNCYEHKNVFINLRNGEWMELADYNSGFNEYKFDDGEYDIMKVEKPQYIGDIFRGKIDYETQILWQRDNPQTLKLKESIKAAELKIREARLNLKTLQDQLNGN